MTLIVNMYSIPASVNVHTRPFMDSFSSVSTRYNKYKEVFDSLDENDQLTGTSLYIGPNGKKLRVSREYLMKLKEEYDSYAYVAAAVNSGAEFVHTYYFVQATFYDKRDIPGYRKMLAALLRGQDIYFKELYGTINDYLMNFGPATISKTINKKHRAMLLTEEGLASLLPVHTKGLVGTGGSLIALEQESKLPFMLDFFGSGAGQIIMVVAKTGYGKTYLMYPVVLEFVRQGVHVSIIDFKGDEWDKVLRHVEGTKVDFSPTSGSFVNVLRLDDLNLTKENALEMLNDAIRFCSDLFALAVNLAPGEGNEQDLYKLMSDACSKLYSQVGLDVNRLETFKNTKNLTYEGVLAKLSDLKSTNSYTPEQKKLIDVVITRASTYFTADSGRGLSFSREVTLNDVLQAPTVVYAFNKNKGNDLSTVDKLRVYMAQALDSKKQSYRKEQRQHTVAVYEELQRTGNMPVFVNDIAHKVTGSRSNNVTVFLLLNAIGVLDANMYSAIRSNITTKIVGKVTERDATILTQQYDCDDIGDYIEKIRKDETKELEHCFAVSYDVGTDANKAVVRTVLPSYLDEEFQTRDRAGDDYGSD